jgi:hypothetical protein
MDEDGFVRQRRNLIVVSVVLLFADALAFRFAEINILGNRMELAEPVRVTPILWAVWSYLLLRYWQAFREHGSESFATFVKGYVGRSATDYALDQGQMQLETTPNVSRDGKNVPIVMVIDLPRRGLQARAQIRYHIQEGEKAAPREMNLPISKLVILWFYVRGSIVATFNRSIVSEKYLPFVFAFAPLAYALYSWWNGGSSPECLAGC